MEDKENAIMGGSLSTLQEALLQDMDTLTDKRKRKNIIVSCTSPTAVGGGGGAPLAGSSGEMTRRRNTNATMQNWMDSGRDIVDRVIRIKEEPARTGRKLLYLIWFVVVFLAILHIVGFHVSPWYYLSSTGSSRYGIYDDDDDDDDVKKKSSPIREVRDSFDEEEEEFMEQKLDAAPRKKVPKSAEIFLACQEVECIEKCARKVTKKCAKSDSCLRERARSCRKKCRKARCEERCKDEPQLGYVEKEMKLEKCKEECQSTKCKNKCELHMQSCKSKCRQNLSKFVCEREPALPTVASLSSPDSSSQSSSSSTPSTPLSLDSDFDFSDDDEPQV